MPTNENKITTTNITPKSPTRKRGGQPGNRNAVKHGFYARHFTKQEIEDFIDMKPLGVYDEIQLVRALMRRVLASLDEDATHADLLETFRAICQGNYALNRLIRTQIYGPLSPVDNEGYNRWRSISGNNYYILDEEEKEMKRENSLEGIVSQIIDELDASGTTIEVRNHD